MRRGLMSSSSFRTIRKVHGLGLILVFSSKEIHRVVVVVIAVGKLVMVLGISLIGAEHRCQLHGNFTDYHPFIYLTHPPEIIRKPSNQGVRVGGVATFFCGARGDPAPNIVWRKNGKKIMGTQSRYSVIESNGVSMLRIEPVRAGRDDAPYECMAENGVGDAVSAEATLTVYEPDKTPSGFPVITQSPTTRVIEIGHTAVMQCKATGSPQPKIYWIKDMKRVDMTNSRYSINAEGSLQIDNSEESDMGRYECVAENSVGTEHTKQTNLYVKVRRVPPTFSRPPEPVYEVMLGGNLSLACVAVGSPMPYVKWRQGVDQELTPENDVPVGRNVMELTNIRHSANYTCVASSTLGIIEATTLVKVQSLPAAPTDVQISEVTATQVRLEWSYKGPEDLQYYVIQYKPKNANQAFSEISGIITMFYVVRTLSPYTEYEFYVIAVNNIGRGPPSLPATCTTGETGIVPP
ncbi:receptor tyrosine phosphatase type r2a [Culex quinquefasciatus]|uniref:protein-tyrosine-phosphatase n=1 Tax=Culex quinquefasciatus TaxID=7176 RepID=B0X1M9_CULQU|nr:receptor tyrosine phosphatase type r2a [Culex quinquefasciatus]|eukprot:XP_001863551.1 receptor tyrosine phosphatase type r2a [Culex quinquefasciatus]